MNAIDALNEGIEYMILECGLEVYSVRLKKYIFSGGISRVFGLAARILFNPLSSLSTPNRFLHGLSGAVVLYHYFCSIEGIACGSPQYIIQWHLVSLSSKRTKTKFSDQLHCPLVNFRTN